jgi:hypothetical protein
MLTFLMQNLAMYLNQFDYQVVKPYWKKGELLTRPFRQPPGQVESEATLWSAAKRKI